MTAKKLTVRRSRMGFSILDIMIALAIVGILASVYNFTMKWSRERAMVALFMADARQVKVAATRFFQDTGFFPPDVSRDVDPGLIAVDGWKNGGHSAKWDDLDLTDWRGPYLENWSAWKRNPWGGSYDWDNYEEGYSSQGIPGGNIYLTLKPGNWGGRVGMPKPAFEDKLEAQGLDRSGWSQVVAVWLSTADPSSGS